MKASLYIKELKKLIDVYGDLEMCIEKLDEDTELWEKIPSCPVFCKTISGVCFVGISEDEE
jgi:hypothetical protein